MLKVMVQNLHSYKVREIELPATAEEISEFFEALNPAGLHDCEVVDVEVTCETEATSVLKGLYNLSLSELNQLAEMLTDDDNFAYVFMACDSLEEAVEKYNNGDYSIYFDCHNDYDLGYEIATACGIVPDDDSILARYFDYEAFGRDCRLEGCFVEVKYGVMVEIR